MSLRLLLGIGCQKGGTSWIARHLRGCPEVAFGARKEMHAFDAYFLPGERDYHAVRIERAASERARLEAAGALSPRLRLRFERASRDYAEAATLVRDIDAYPEYFLRRLSERHGASLAADVTPAYSLLSAEHWETVRRLIEPRGLAIKIVFVMRDPVLRLDSAFRMYRRNEARLIALENPEAETRPAGPLASERLIDFAFRDRNLERSRFDLTIASIEAVFPREAIHYDFFETFFNAAAVARLAEHLALAARPPDFATKVNASSPEFGADRAELAHLRELLEPAYAFCAARFGEERLKAIWPTA